MKRTERGVEELLGELEADPMAQRRGPSVRDFGKKAERGMKPLVGRFEALIERHHPPAFPFLIATLEGHPSQRLGAALEAAFLDSGDPPLLEALARHADPSVAEHHPIGVASIARAAFALGPRRAWELLGDKLGDRAGEKLADARSLELARAALVAMDDMGPDERAACDPRWIDALHDALHGDDGALAATAASLLGKAGDRSAVPRVLELLERDAVPLDGIVSALDALGDASIVPVIRAEAARRKSAERGAAKALEKLARALETREAPVPGVRELVPYADGSEVPTDDRFPLAALLRDGNVLVNGAMRCQVRIRRAGTLVLPTGALAACDPLASTSAVAFTHTLAPGRYAVALSVLAFETEGDDVVGAATVRVAPGEVVRWEVCDPATYGVTHARGAFVDASVLPALAALGDLPGSAARVAANRRGGLVLDRISGANLVSFPSGAGEGEYATFVGVGADGAIVCITTSFDVVRTGT